MNLRSQYSPSKKTVITGSTGFIGSLFTQNCQNSDFHDLDFADTPSNTVVIHAAADLSQTRESLAENSLIDSYVLEETNKKHRGIIYLSTNNVYAKSFHCRTTESLRGHDYYSASKILGEQLIRDMSATPYLILRLADVFGVGQKHGNLFKALEKCITNGSAIQLHGDGLKRRTYIHVRELVNLLHWLADLNFESAACSKIINVGYPTAPTVRNIVEKASTLTGFPLEQKILSPDFSAIDTRTMEVSFPYGYEPLWLDFDSAFEAYIEELKNQNNEGNQ